MKTIHLRVLHQVQHLWEQIRYRPILHWCLSLILVFYMFVHSGSVLQFIDPRSASIDVGILSLLILSIFSFILITGISLLAQEWLWPTLGLFRKYQFIHLFNSISPWQQFKVYGFAFACLLSVSVALILAIF